MQGACAHKLMLPVEGALERLLRRRRRQLALRHQTLVELLRARACENDVNFWVAHRTNNKLSLSSESSFFFARLLACSLRVSVRVRKAFSSVSFKLKSELNNQYCRLQALSLFRYTQKFTQQRNRSTQAQMSLTWNARVDSHTNTHKLKSKLTLLATRRATGKFIGALHNMCVCTRQLLASLFSALQTFTSSSSSSSASSLLLRSGQSSLVLTHWLFRLIVFGNCSTTTTTRYRPPASLRARARAGNNWHGATN